MTPERFGDSVQAPMNVAIAASAMAYPTRIAVPVAKPAPGAEGCANV
ncbi:hypothetical protein ACQP04_07860 [Pseudonocardia halophobica]